MHDTSMTLDNIIERLNEATDVAGTDLSWTLDYYEADPPHLYLTHPVTTQQYGATIFGWKTGGTAEITAVFEQAVRENPRPVAKPASLTEIRSAPDPTTIRILEELLKDARAGELRGFAVAMVYEGRHTDYSVHTGDCALADLLMAAERMKHRVLTEILNA